MKIGIKLEMEAEVLKMLNAVAEDAGLTLEAWMKERLYSALTPKTVYAPHAQKYSKTFLPPEFAAWYTAKACKRPSRKAAYRTLLRYWWDKLPLPGVEGHPHWPLLPGGWSFHTLDWQVFISDEYKAARSNYLQKRKDRTMAFSSYVEDSPSK